MEEINSTNPIEPIVVRVETRLERILPDFLARRREDLEVLGEAFLQGDYEAIRVFGHRMKGTGGAYGLEWVSVSGKSLENAAKQQNREATKALLDSFAEYLERIKVVYE